MKQKLLKALIVLDERENSWFLNGAFHEAIDFHLMDVKALPVNMQDFHRVLREVAEQAPDVLLLDSTLPSHYVLRMALQVGDKFPDLAIILLPDIRGAVSQSAGADSALVATDNIARIMRYTHDRLGLQRTLLQLALRDDLTGLHNRRGFIALATQHLQWARDTEQHMLMFFADLDGLKWINDRFGHGEGDRAITLAAACIKETFRKSDVTARLSGDEFVALILEEPGRGAETICRRLQMNLDDCAGPESPYKLSLSVGVAHFDPDKPVTLQELMRQADSALYRHKRKERSSVSGGVTIANSEAPARVGAKQLSLGESTAAASNGHWLSAAPLELNPPGSLALMTSGPLSPIEPTAPRG
jgi:diguanylate cyclase (GGDEF)-like protein